MPYKDPERQRAAVRRHKIEARLGSNPSREALLEAEVRSLKSRLRRAHTAERDARRQTRGRQGNGANGKTETGAMIERLRLVIEDLKDGGRSAFPAVAIDAAVDDLGRLISDIQLGTVK
jgi:hypothetical protein